MFIQELIKKIIFDDTNVGLYRPPKTSPIQRRGEEALVVRWDVEDYEAVEQNLEGLTTDVPEYCYWGDPEMLPAPYYGHVRVSQSTAL